MAAQSKPSADAGTHIPRSPETWLIIVDNGWFGPPRFKAARFVHQTKSRVYYADRWDSQRFCAADKVAARDLTPEAAKLAAEQLAAVRNVYDQDRKAAEAECAERARKILEAVRAGPRVAAGSEGEAEAPEGQP